MSKSTSIKLIIGAVAMLAFPFFWQSSLIYRPLGATSGFHVVSMLSWPLSQLAPVVILVALIPWIKRIWENS